MWEKIAKDWNSDILWQILSNSVILTNILHIMYLNWYNANFEDKKYLKNFFNSNYIA